MYQYQYGLDHYAIVETKEDWDIYYHKGTEMLSYHHIAPKDIPTQFPAYFTEWTEIWEGKDGYDRTIDWYKPCTAEDAKAALRKELTRRMENIQYLYDRYAAD